MQDLKLTDTLHPGITFCQSLTSLDKAITAAIADSTPEVRVTVMQVTPTNKKIEKSSLWQIYFLLHDHG